MEIRYVNKNDDPLEISKIYESSWKYAYKGIIPQDYLDSIPTGQWANSINKVGLNSLVLIEQGRIIGTASFCKSRWEKYSDYGEVVSIYFLPDYIGKGYGSLLLNKCIEELKSSAILSSSFENLPDHIFSIVIYTQFAHRKFLR